MILKNCAIYGVTTSWCTPFKLYLILKDHSVVMGLISASMEEEGEVQRRQVSRAKLLRHTIRGSGLLGCTDVFYFYQIVQMPRDFRDNA